MENEKPAAPEPQSTTPATPTIEQSKKSYGRNWKKLVLIYLAVGAIIYGGIYYFVLSKQGSKPYSTPVTKTTVSPAPSMAADPTADWKTYKSEAIGFSFKYPPSFDIKDRSAELPPVNVAIVEKPDDVMSPYIIMSGINTFPSVTDYIKDPINRLTFVKVQKIGANEFTVVRLQEQGDTPPGRRTQYLIKNGNAILTIDNVHIAPVKEEIFDQILSTFKFTTDKTACSETDPQWVSKQFGTAWNIQYPSDWAVDERGVPTHGSLSLEGCYKQSRYKVGFGYPMGLYNSLNAWVDAEMSRIPQNQKTNIEVLDVVVGGTPSKKVLNVPSPLYSDNIAHHVYIWNQGNTNPRTITISQIAGAKNVQQMEELLDLFLKGIK
ncbi:MAG TPA: hypothetical protein VNA13_00100 [Xanthomonadales bacterium]|nr:hypothetical protein [Xanthomonadales bacterium]